MKRQAIAAARGQRAFVALLGAAGALLLSACSPLQPQERAQPDLPSAWTPGEAATAATAATTATLPWQDFVRDPALRELVEQALAHNQDLRIAVLQIEQARAQFQIRGADRLPTVNLGLAGSRATSGEDQAIKSSYQSGLNLSSWELDLFGRLASLEQGAQAQYLATRQAAEAVRLSLVASVASAWFNLQASEAQRQLANQTLVAREAGLRLTRLRHDNGVASALELRGAESLAAAARAALAQQERQRELDTNALTQLVGRPLSALASAPPSQLPDPLAALAEVPIGLPSEVLLQRPDVRAAEQQLAAADAQIGAARAAFFPRIALTASLGSASSALSGLFSAGTWGWSLAPQALLPIFDAGRNRAGLESARAGREIALAQYDKAIQVAFREVRDALAGRATLAPQLQAQQALVAAESERVRLSDLRLQQGAASQIELLDAQRSLFAAQQALLQTRLALAQNQVALYRALGGWRAADAD